MIGGLFLNTLSFIVVK
uniref:Truncated non-structural protein 3c n=1 Tax=Feline coronavirus TaxID=12663 RepID=A0A2Z6FAC1_9ALPC|nr:truncated non-structural protein 3c [Feline coronavirus]